MISASSRSFKSNLLIVVVDVAVFKFELSSFALFKAVKPAGHAVSDLFSAVIGAGAGGAGAIFFLVRVKCDGSMLCNGSFSLPI